MLDPAKASGYVTNGSGGNADRPSDGGRYETRGLGQQPGHPVASELSELADLAEQYEL